MTFTSDSHEPRRRFTADEVMRMVEIGVIGSDERVELIEGELIVLSPQGSLHSSLTVKLRKRIEHGYGAKYHVRDHSPVRGTHDSIPEPDIAVVHGDLEAFFDALPGPENIPLVVEVSDSTLHRDRRKANVYAQAGYANYWLVNLDARCVEVHTLPGPQGEYRKREILSESDTLILPSTTYSLTVRELLPPQ